MLALKYALMVIGGAIVGMVASFAGLGGGVIMVPLLMFLGYPAQQAVGTSVFAILIIAVSSLIAHYRLGNVDYRVGILLGVGGIIGAQYGAVLLEGVPTAAFKKVFACILVALALYLFLKK